jgi:hypothetical protein
MRTVKLMEHRAEHRLIRQRSLRGGPCPNASMCLEHGLRTGEGLISGRAQAATAARGTDNAENRILSAIAAVQPSRVRPTRA